MRICLISDTHGLLDKAVFTHFDQCDEIWHAGDFGTMAVAEELAAFRPLKGVYGNIDGRELRVNFPETAGFTCQGLKVIMRHIGGYAGDRKSVVSGKSVSERVDLGGGRSVK